MRKTEKKEESLMVINGIKKQCFKSKPECKVTFKLPKDAASDDSVVVVV